MSRYVRSADREADKERKDEQLVSINKEIQQLLWMRRR